MMQNVISVNRLIVLDRVNRLLQFCQTDDHYDEATELMRKHSIAAEELNARRMDTNRPIYRSLTTLVTTARRRSA